jgi:ABC-type dipeptide/oligopeptide/nickel transport system permease component
MDGLVKKERLHWSLPLIGTSLAVACLALVLGFHLGIPAAEGQDNPWLMRGLTGWTIAFAVLPISWITQSIRQHGQHSAPPAAAL